MVLLFPSLSPRVPPHETSSPSVSDVETHGKAPGPSSRCPVSSSRTSSWFSRMKREAPPNLAERALPNCWIRGGRELEKGGQKGRANGNEGHVASHADETEEELNISNMMPDIPNTNESGLSTKRERSSIPQTGANKTWIYPSSAQFFRALQRRGKEAEKETIPVVVYVHNFVNEETWERIRAIEKKHPECAEATLTRFCGRSEDLTLTARLMKRLGSWGELFDRHDWYIDRCGKQVRYIIDYYDDPKAANIAEVYIHARPAPFDSFENFKDVMTHTLQSLWGGDRP